MKKLKLNESQLNVFNKLKANTYYIDKYFSDALICENLEYSEFSIENLKEIKTFKSRLEFCKKYLKQIGAGSSRIVFELPDGSALKLAKNKKGLGQCAGEVDIIDEDNPLLARILDWDEIDGHVVFVIMERAKPASPSDFKRLLNINFNKVFSVAKEFSVDTAIRKKDYRNQHKYFIKYLYGYSKANNNRAFYDFVTYLEEYIIGNDIVLFGDVTRIVNWGVVGNQLVLIDYGLNDMVYNDHY